MTETNHLTALKAKHAALDDAIKEEMARPLPDEAAISNLKRQKLKLKEGGEVYLFATTLANGEKVLIRGEKSEGKE